MLAHKYSKLLEKPKVINLEKDNNNESDIEMEQEQPSHNIKSRQEMSVFKNSLLLGGSLKNRSYEKQEKERQKKQNQAKKKSNQRNLRHGHHQCVVLSDKEDNESIKCLQNFTQKDAIRKRLKRIAMVSNKVKLQKRDENTQECSICLTDLKQKDEIHKGLLPCGHIYCLECILESSKFSNRCPYCRTSFFTIKNDYKHIQIQQANRHTTNQDPMDEPCYICGRNDDFDRLLQCECCEYAFCHTYCDPRLNSDRPPNGEWFCQSCSDMLRNQEQEEGYSVEMMQSQVD